MLVHEKLHMAGTCSPICCCCCAAASSSALRLSSSLMEPWLVLPSRVPSGTVGRPPSTVVRRLLETQVS